MERVHINTTQNVRIDYQLATLSDRAIAWLIDYVVIIGWALLMYQIMSDVPFFETETGSYVFVLAILLPALFYHLLSELLLNGQSVGKLVMKIKVVRLDGSQPALGNYLLRWIIRLFEFLLFPGLSLIVYLITGTGQRLGDIFAGTTVIRRRRRYSLEDTILHTVSTAYQPRFPQVVNLTARDVEIIKEGLKYSIRYKNYNTLSLLNDQVSKALGVENHGIPYGEFLDAVIRDYNYFQAADAAEH